MRGKSALHTHEPRSAKPQPFRPIRLTATVVAVALLIVLLFVFAINLPWTAIRRTMRARRPAAGREV